MWSLRLAGITFASVFLLFTQLGEPVFAGDFRDTEWAMSPAQVKSVENAEFKFEQAEKLVFADRLFGRSVRVEYEFWDDKLLSGSYRFREELPRSVILEKLREKYGPAVKQRPFPGYRRYWFESPITYIAVDTTYELVVSLTYASKAVLQLRDQKSEKNL